MSSAHIASDEESTPDASVTLDSFISELSPRQPATKRSGSTVDAANAPMSPVKRTKDALSFITLMVGEEATKKPPFKVDAVRALLGKVGELQESISDLLAANASLNGRLSESRAQNAGLVAQFAAVLSEREAACAAKIATALKSRPVTEVLHTSAPQTFANVTRVGRKKSRSRSRNTARQKSKSAARAKKLLESRSGPPEEAFVVTPTADKDVTACKNELWSVIKKHNSAPRIHSIVGKSGRLIIKPQDKETTDLLKKIGRSKTCNLTADTPLLPRLRFDHVDREIDPKELSDLVALQNLELNVDPVDAADFISPVFRTGPMEGVSASWVCSINPKYYSSLLALPIFVGLMRCQVTKFDRVTQCYRCFRFGHPVAYCKEVDAACVHCAKAGHLVADCPSASLPPRCANCGGSHSATDVLCSARTAFQANLLRRTDFGAPPSAPL
ncbi:Zinc finger, CCHC-type [Cinara cedri]|uniref:Zinc finger, CCHC-type n=1 Tax=Cinara cedri TaxID=506608 RepID=A0A5E4NS63_9HEMI|nr:Zinc finger, CCHC-type [Cinara cedri]